MIKYLSMCKMQQGKTYYIVLHNILYKINSFLKVKIEAMLPLVKQMNKKKSLYINIFEKRDLAFDKKTLTGINKNAKMLDRSEN